MWTGIIEMEHAKRMIFTPYTRGEGFYPNKELEQFNGRESILDFGCGIGRNLKVLADNCSRVNGYDHPNMIKLARKYLGMSYSSYVNFISTPISNLKGHKFNLTIAIVVFQHMYHKDLHEALNQLSQVTKELFIIGRGYADDKNYNVWQVVNQYFEPIDPIDITDGSERHQQGLWKPRTALSS